MPLVKIKLLFKTVNFDLLFKLGIIVSVEFPSNFPFHSFASLVIAYKYPFLLILISESLNIDSLERTILSVPFIR